jgi:hypothetical protein
MAVACTVSFVDQPTLLDKVVWCRAASRLVVGVVGRSRFERGEGFRLPTGMILDQDRLRMINNNFLEIKRTMKVTELEGLQKWLRGGFERGRFLADWGSKVNRLLRIGLPLVRD